MLACEYETYNYFAEVGVLAGVVPAAGHSGRRSSTPQFGMVPFLANAALDAAGYGFWADVEHSVCTVGSGGLFGVSQRTEKKPHGAYFVYCTAGA